MPHSEPNPLAAIAYASRRPGSDSAPLSPALASQLASPTPLAPCNEQQTTNTDQSPNPQSAICNPQSLDLSSPAGMDRVRLAAAYIETDLVTSCETRRALPPSDPSFSALLHRDAKTLWSVTSVRKTIITLDRYLDDLAEYKQSQAAAQAQSEAEQARLQAEAEARAELRRQAIERAEELLTQLAAEDPAFQAALDKAGADLAAEFARMRDPEPDSPVSAQKRIDDEAVAISRQLLNKFYNAHPYSGIKPSVQSEAADRLARAGRGEPVPSTPIPDPDDEDDDWADDDWGDDDDDAIDINDSLGARTPSSAIAPDDDDALDIDESPGARTPSSAIAPSDPSPDLQQDAVSGVRQPCCRFSSPAPLQPFNPALPTSYSAPSSDSHPSTPRSEIRNPQSAIRNCAVPVCPTLSPRRLESFMAKSSPLPEPALTSPDPSSSMSTESGAAIPIPTPDVPTYPLSRIYSSPQRTPVSVPYAKGPPTF